MGKKLLLITGLIAALTSLSACSTIESLKTLKHEGISRTYPVSRDQAWELAKKAMVEAGGRIAVEKPSENYLAAETGMTMFSSGVLLGAWIEPAGESQTQVTFLSKRKISTQVAQPVTSDDLHMRFQMNMNLISAGLASNSPDQKSAGGYGNIPTKKYGDIPLHENGTENESTSGGTYEGGPIMVIGYPLDGQQVGSTTVRVKGICVSGAGLEKIEWYVNNTRGGDARGIAGTRKSNEAGAPAITEYPFEFDVGLADGTNAIKVIAVDKNGMASEKTVQVIKTSHVASRDLPADTQLPTIRAFVVGVSKYKDPQLDLGYARADAELMAQTLQSKYVGARASHIKLLVDEDATRVNVISTLNEFLKRSGRDDLVILYFAMHGLGDPEGGDDFYFMCHDSDVRMLEATALSRGSLEKLISRSDTQRIIVITDACHAGILGTSGPGKRNPAAINYTLLKRIAEVEGKGVTFFSASDANEYSQETGDLGHGVFTYFLVDGLKGKADHNGDGFVDLMEIEEYTYEKVKEKTKGAQRPRMVRPISKYLPLSKVK